MNDLPRIKTYSGIWFDFLDPKPEAIRIEDIAHALAHICRFGGQAVRFYSVAQHSVLVAGLLTCREPLVRRWGLLHDAAEAYIGDVVRPLKALLPKYREIEERIERAIARRFDLEWPIPEPVKHADREALALEGLEYMDGREDEFGISELPYKERPELLSMEPGQAELLFHETFGALFPHEVQA